MKNCFYLFCAVLLFSFSSKAQPCSELISWKTIDSLNVIGEFRKALKGLDSFLTCELVEDSATDYLQGLMWKYRLLRNRRKYKKAFLIAEEALSFQKKNLPSDFQNIDLQLCYLEACVLTGKTTQISNNFANAEKILSRMSTYDVVSWAYFYFIKGFYAQHGSRDKDAAISSYQKALSLYLEMENPAAYHLGQTLRYLGILKRIDGDLERALEYFEQELATYQKHYPSTHIEIANTNFNIGNVHYGLFDYQKALDHYLPCFEIWNKRYKPGAKYLRMLNEAIGDMYWELNHRTQALTFYERAEFKEKKLNLDQSVPQTKRGDSLLQIGKYDGAINYYQEALAFRAKEYGEKHSMTGACQNYIARAYQYAGKTEEALHAYQKAIAILSNTNDLDSSYYSNPQLNADFSSGQYLLEALLAKSQLLKERFDQSGKQRDLEVAFETQQLSISLLEDIRQGPLSFASKLFWTQKAFPMLEVALETAALLHVKTKDPLFLETAFHIAEKAKAILLQSTLQENYAASYSGIPDSILIQEKALKRAIIENEGKIALEEQRCSQRRSNRLELRKEQLLANRTNYDRFLHQLKIDFPKYYALKYNVETTTLYDLKQSLLLDEQSALLSFFEGEKSIYVFLLSLNELQLFRVDRNKDYEKNMLLFYNSLTNLEDLLRKPQQTYEIFVQSSSALYQQLLAAPLKTCPQNIARLILVPDGQLAYIPFECLLTDSTKSTKRDYRKLPYLFRKFALSYGQSASLLKTAYAASNQAYKTKNYLGFAPSYTDLQHKSFSSSLPKLSYHEREVREAAQIFDGEIYLSEKASKQNFFDHAQEAIILHLAMHALTNDEEPLLSSMLFAAKDTIQNDGLLYAYELYELELDAALTILSACETGKGIWQRGEGMMSLERAFQYAGCPALLSSLWTVDDAATKDLIAPFLENIKQGLAKDIALQKARTSFLEQADPAILAPFFWAGFRLTGNREVIETRKKKAWKLLITGLVLLGIIFGGIRWYTRTT